MCVSLEEGSSGPSQGFRWLWPWRTSWVYLHERPGVRTTQQSCSWIPGPLRLLDNCYVKPLCFGAITRQRQLLYLLMDVTPVAVPCLSDVTVSSSWLTSRGVQSCWISPVLKKTLSWSHIFCSPVFPDSCQLLSVVASSDSFFPLLSWTIQLGLSALQKLLSSENHPSAIQPQIWSSVLI